MNAQQWFIKKDAKAYGPFSTEQIKQFAIAKKLLPEHELASSQNGPWTLASKARGLFPAIVEANEVDEVPAPPGAKLAASAMALTSNLFNQAKGLMRSDVPAETVIVNVVSPPQRSEPNVLSQFMADGQDSALVVKMHQRVSELCTSEEQILYLAVQSKPIANFSPDVVALTNRRFMIFRPKMLGRMTFFDCLWKDCKNVHFQENILGSTITFTCLNGTKEEIDYLPKAQGRQIYRKAQEQEEAAIKYRRDLQLEEIQAGADKTVFNQAIATGPTTAPVDVVARLNQLKGLLDSGILTQAEFDSKKAELVKQL